MSATCRITVLLPAMLGPVMTRSCASSASSRTSLGTKRLAAPSTRSTTGCRPPSICEHAPSRPPRAARSRTRRRTARSDSSASTVATASAAARRRRRRGHHLGPQLLEELRSSSAHAPLLGGEHLLLVLLELGGDEALGAHRGLLADVVLGHQVQVRAGHLEVVAEDLVVADLERGDPGALALARLELEQVVLAARWTAPPARPARRGSPGG